MKTVTFATKLPADLTETLSELCKRLGLKKSALVESALRERIEDLVDAHDLREAMTQETRFHSWQSVKAELSAAPHARPRRPATKSK